MRRPGEWNGGPSVLGGIVALFAVIFGIGYAVYSIGKAVFGGGEAAVVQTKDKNGNPIPVGIVGTWKRAGGPGASTETLTFTPGGSITWGRLGSTDHVASFLLSGMKLRVRSSTNEYVGMDYRVELTDAADELIIGGSNGGYEHTFGGLAQLQGKWRKNQPAAEVVVGTGPLGEANKQIRKFEQKRGLLQPLLQNAIEERKELVQKLRDAGVNKPADLKDNIRGRRLAESLQRVSTEIEGMENQISAIDDAISQAKAVARRLERESAGITPTELGNLSAQLRDVEERTDGARRPITPLDLEATLEKALKK